MDPDEAPMCRNIRVLSHFEPPTSPEEIRDAALQYVRKVSGTQKPKIVDQTAFDAAVSEIAASTERLLHSLAPGGPTRTREGERLKARARWVLREAKLREV
jgi:hypothetical protein